MKTTNKPNTLATTKRLLYYVTSTFKLHFFIVCIAIIISAIAGMAGPLFLMVLIDDFITPLIGQQHPDFMPLLQTILMLGVLYYAGVIATFVYNRLMVTIGQGVLKRIRDELFEHMQTLPIQYFDTHSHGELMSVYTNDTDTLRQMISQSIPQVFSALISVVTIFIVMCIMSIPLSLLAVVFVIIMIILTKLIGGKSGKYFIHQQRDLSSVNGFIEEMINGQKVIKIFTHEEESKQQFDKWNEQLCESASKANKYANIMMPIMGNIGNIHYVATAILGGVLLINHSAGLTIGMVASFLQFTKSFNQPFSQISQQLNSIVMALAGAGRIFTLMDERSEEDGGIVTLANVIKKDGTFIETKEKGGLWAWKHPHDQSVDYVPLQGNIVFNHVIFGYDEKTVILKDISLYAHEGQKVAFVGSTGAGKTTITNLINRFYDISSGSILYDGIDVKLIKKADLRRSLGIVLQDTHLFTGTIMDNLRYGKLDASDEEIIEAAKLANAHDFISLLPNGYQTPLYGEGDQLSQGQRQLLAITRAAVANPPVLILDEATSSIDTRTEAIVQNGMDALMKGRTVLVIAHRLSTIRNSDAIIVLDHGEIIERGSHERLLDKRGSYYELYTGIQELD